MIRLVGLGVLFVFGALLLRGAPPPDPLSTGEGMLGALCMALAIVGAFAFGAGGSPGTTRPPTADLQEDLQALGSDAFLGQCHLVSGPEPDPGHPGAMPIALWRPPERYGRVLVLECFNGTSRADGTYERLAKSVSATHRTPLSAAAASYGVTEDVYRLLARRA